jgi:hypothetical protein
MPENDDDIQVEVWDDPVWTPALTALTDQSNPKPIAELLSQGLVPPNIVAQQLGIMLDPPDGYLGPSLIMKTPKRGWRDAIVALVEDRKLRARILEVRGDNGKVEAEIAMVSEETGLSRSKLYEVWKLDDRETVFRSQVMLGFGQRTSTRSSPPKRRKSRGL